MTNPVLKRDWAVGAACRSHDPEIWFATPKDAATIAEAQRICATCPVQASCVLYAKETGSTDGVWSGEYLDKPAQSSRQWVHGTDAGWKRHRRLGERPCSSCVQGHVRFGEDRWAKR
jgi:WhiB family redox-sensing transcriptional regulator